jgi:hypothetical protein
MIGFMLFPSRLRGLAGDLAALLWRQLGGSHLAAFASEFYGGFVFHFSVKSVTSMELMSVGGEKWSNISSTAFLA